MQIVTTRLGTFQTTRTSAVAIAVYRAGRPIHHCRRLVEVGQLFAQTIIKESKLNKPALDHLYFGRYATTFRLDGTEVKRPTVSDASVRFKLVPIDQFQKLLEQDFRRHHGVL